MLYQQDDEVGIPEACKKVWWCTQMLPGKSNKGGREDKNLNKSGGFLGGSLILTPSPPGAVSMGHTAQHATSQNQSVFPVRLWVM